MRYSKEIPVLAEYDVAVCGGGPAGFPAALQAARLGAKTVILEKSNMLGGVLTIGRDNEIALFNAGSRPVVRGIGWEFVTRLEKLGYAHIPRFASDIPHYLQGVSVNIPMAAWLLDEMCAESKVDVRYFAVLVDMVKRPDGWVLVFASKAALYAVAARRVIDCTGDGDACVLAGAAYELGDPETGELQPGTLGFFVRSGDLSGLDEEKMREEQKKSLAAGELLPQDVWSAGQSPTLALRNNGININHVAVGCDYEQNRSLIEREGRKSVARLYRWLKKNVGSADPEIIGTAGEVAFRETRRIVCRKRVTAEEYVAGVRHGDDISYSYYPIDLHRDDAGGDTLHNVFLDENHVPAIPYGALIPRGVDNMLVAGRCIGGDRLAQSAYRVKASCMAMGQAAGAAAALSALYGTALPKVDLDALRSTLRSHGAIVPPELSR